MVFKHNEITLEDLGAGISRKILAHDTNLMVVEVFFEKGSVGNPHSHVHEQVAYVKKGKFEFVLDGNKTILEEGDSIFLPSHSLHGAVCIEQGILLDIFTPQREEFLSST